MPDNVMEALAASTAVATLPLGILAVTFVSLTAGIAVFVLGWLLLVPMFGVAHETLLSDQDSSPRVETAAAQQASTDPVEELRNRYARGEIDDAELETRLDTLLEMEGIGVDNSDIEAVKQTLDTEQRADPTPATKRSADQREHLTENE